MSTTPPPPQRHPTGAPSPKNPSGATHPAAFIVAWAVLGIVLQRVVPLHLPAWRAVGAMGTATTFIGVVVTVWSLVELARHRTTVEHKVATTALVTTGPFRFSRNPTYIGLMAILLGLAVEYDNVWLAFLVAGFAAGIGKFTVRREEAYLERVFGDEYRGYRTSVRRWL